VLQAAEKARAKPQESSGHDFIGCGKTRAKPQEASGHDFTACGKTRERACFVTGHDFSRAASIAKQTLGFSPCRGHGSPQTGLSPWGGDPSLLGIGDTTNPLNPPVILSDRSEAKEVEGSAFVSLSGRRPKLPCPIHPKHHRGWVGYHEPSRFTCHPERPKRSEGSRRTCICLFSGRRQKLPCPIHPQHHRGWVGNHKPSVRRPTR